MKQLRGRVSQPNPYALHSKALQGIIFILVIDYGISLAEGKDTL